MIVGSYLTANPCPQRGWNFPRDSFDPIGQWHASLKRLKLAGVLIHDGLDPKIIASHRDPKFRFEQVDIGGERHVIYLTRFRLYLDFLDNHPEIERLFFTDVTDLVALHSPFPSIEPNKIYVGCEPTSVGASRFMWRIVGLSYGWPGRVRFLSILNKQLLNCGIFGGHRDPVYKLISGVVREMEQILPTADSDMGAFNLVVRECFQDEDIVTDYPLHSCFKRFEPRRDVYFRHK